MIEGPACAGREHPVIGVRLAGGDVATELGALEERLEARPTPVAPSMFAVNESLVDQRCESRFDGPLLRAGPGDGRLGCVARCASVGVSRSFPQRASSSFSRA